MNAVAHISAHFGHVLQDNYRTDASFITQDGIHIPRNTQYPIIVFSAGKNQVQTFAQQMQTAPELEVMYFINEMIETTKDDEIQTSVSQQPFANVQFLGVGIFGENSLVKGLTKKYTLWS